MRPTFTEDVTTPRGPLLVGMADDEFLNYCQQPSELRIERTADPKTETTYLYRPGQPAPEVVPDFDHTPSGEAMLPGLQLKSRELR